MSARKRPLTDSTSPQLAAVFLTRYGCCQPAHPPHRCPVVLVSGPTDDAHLIVPPMNAVWPGESMRAKLLEEEGKKSCHSFFGSAISSSMHARGDLRCGEYSRFLLHYCDISTDRFQDGSHRSSIYD